MKYFLDTEFLEGPQDKKIFGIKIGQTKPTIDLISIGIVSDDGREYYAISKDFNLKEAWNRFDWKQRSKEEIKHTPALGTIYKDYWLRNNVLKPIFNDWVKEDSHWTNKDTTLGNWSFTYKNFKYFLNKHGKSNKEIAKEITAFTTTSTFKPTPFGRIGYSKGPGTERVQGEFYFDDPIFYAYYADYDWVVFCWLFGKMMDLPEGFPMYCIDLKQIMDEKKWVTAWRDRNVKEHPDYPTNDNEHLALDDARWNKKLYEFLQTI